MKQILKASFLLVVAFIASVLFVSAQDTTLNIPNVIDQGKQVIQAASGHDLTYKIFLFAAILGTLIRIVITAIKGVKNKTNGSPMQFVFSYWVKDNVLSKIVTLAAFLFSFSFVVSLPQKAWVYVIAGVIGLIVGWLLDWVTDMLKSVMPLYKANETDPPVPPKG